MSAVIFKSHPSECTEDIHSLFTKWGGDGCILVQAIFSCHRSMTRATKGLVIEEAKKMFESGVKKGNYSPDCDEHITIFDAVVNGVYDGNVNNTKKASKTPKKKSSYFGFG